MPLTALGTYEVAATLPGGDGPREILTRTVFFFPILRFVGVLGGIAGLGMLRMRRVRQSLWSWLIALPVIASLMFMLPMSNEMLNWGRLWWFTQMCVVSVSLAIICRFKKRRRIWAVLTVMLLAVIASCAESLQEGIDFFMAFILLNLGVGLLSSITMIAGLLACMRRLTRWRLAGGLFTGWLVASVGIFGLATRMGMPLTLHYVLWIAALNLPTAIVCFALIAFNARCWQGIKRACANSDPQERPSGPLGGRLAVSSGQ